FRVYREAKTGVYDYVASIAYDSLSEYHDYTSDPNTTSYKYKLALVDTCGAVSGMSDFHSTIHLQSSNGNFQWTLYDIQNAGNPVSFYRIYRDDNNAGTFLPISSTIPGGNSTYTDVNYLSYPKAKYRVDVNWTIKCTPTRNQVNTTRSNIKSSAAAISVEEWTQNNTIQLYPNPTTEAVTIELPAGYKKYELQVYDMLGQLVYSETLATAGVSGEILTKQIDVSSFRKGIYTVSVQTEKGNAYKKLTIQ
ncbi:MAG: T9SS type A sorting domain-containing protein, partial [Bacteroidetes bacterium]|nr:T9SS type A sorting domain-containing protein [Bacteroidota bacterium]